MTWKTHLYEQLVVRLDDSIVNHSKT